MTTRQWRTELNTGEWPGGIGAYSAAPASPYKSLVYTECWGMTKTRDNTGAHNGYVAACGNGIEPGCNIHPGVSLKKILRFKVVNIRRK